MIQMVQVVQVLLTNFGIETQAVLALLADFGHHHQIYWMARDESDGVIGRELFHFYVKMIQRPF